MRTRPRRTARGTAAARAAGRNGAGRREPSPDGDDHPPLVWRRPMLPKVDSLPLAETQFSAGDRNHDRALSQHSANVRRHVVGTLRVMLVLRVTVRREAAHECLEVTADARVPVLPGDD